MNNKWKVGDAGKTRGGKDYVVTEVDDDDDTRQPAFSKITMPGEDPAGRWHREDGRSNLGASDADRDLLPPTHNINTGERYDAALKVGDKVRAVKKYDWHLPTGIGTVVDINSGGDVEIDFPEWDGGHNGSSGEHIWTRWNFRKFDGGHECLQRVDDGTSTSEPQPLRLQVGKKYRKRNGEVITIDRIGRSHPFSDTHPFMEAGTRFSYREDGRYNASGDACSDDLIEEVVDEPAAPWEVAMLGDEVYFSIISLFRLNREGDKWRMTVVDSGSDCGLRTDDDVREKFRSGDWTLADKPADVVIVDSMTADAPPQLKVDGGKAAERLNAFGDECLRDEVAMHAMAAIIGKTALTPAILGDMDLPTMTARGAFDYADAFMAERARRYGNG